MDEHILAAVGRLDETVTLLRVEPFHGTGRHCSFLIARACRRDRAGIARLQSIQFSGSALQVAAMERLGPSSDGPKSIPPTATRNRWASSRRALRPRFAAPAVRSKIGHPR